MKWLALVRKFIRGLMLRRKLKRPVRGSFSEKVHIAERLVSLGLVRLDIFTPYVTLDLELYNSFASRDALHSFMKRVRILINERRAAFNGAASEGMALAPDGSARLSPLQPSEAVNFSVNVLDEVFLIGSFNEYDIAVKTFEQARREMMEKGQDD